MKEKPLIMPNSEVQRIKDEYIDRDTQMPWNDWRRNIYHPRNPLGHLFTEHNHTIFIDAINFLNFDLHNKRVLDVGCGYGAWLRYLVELGASPRNCVGIDLSQVRISMAAEKNPAINWKVQNSSELKSVNDGFDLILQILMFSSIIDSNLQKRIANELCRVLRPGGYIFWIDLLSPTSAKLVGFSEEDVRAVFPSMTIVYKKKVHPKYFRKINGKNGWIANLIFRFTNLGSESILLVLKKEDDRSGK